MPSSEHKLHTLAAIPNKLCRGTRGHGIPPTAVTSVEPFHINHVASGFNLPGKFDTWSFDLETGANYCPSFLAILVLMGFFILSLWACQTHHVTSRPWPLTLDVTAVVGDADSSCSICVPSLKFVGLTVRKIWRTFGLSISRSGDLDLWPLTSK